MYVKYHGLAFVEGWNEVDLMTAMYVYITARYSQLGHFFLFFTLKSLYFDGFFFLPARIHFLKIWYMSSKNFFIPLSGICCSDKRIKCLQGTTCGKGRRNF